MADTEFDETCDLLIIGSGGASICAALVAKDAGAEPLIVEKTDKLGGSTALSGGVLWVPNNSLMKREGVEDSFEKASTYLEACSAGAGAAASPERRRAFLEQAPRVADYLEAKGMKWYRSDGWSDYHEGELPGGVARGRTLEAKMFDVRELGAWARRLRLREVDMPIDTSEMGWLSLNWHGTKSKLTYLRTALRLLRNRLGARLVRRGAALQARLLQIAVRAGVRFETDTSLVDLIEEDGRIVGAIVGEGAGRRRIQARRGVLLNTGGFSHNEDMRKQHQAAPISTRYTSANPGDTGEAIQIAVKHGADIGLMDLSWWIPLSEVAPGQHAYHNPLDIGKPYTILVDGTGQRYVNEATSYVRVGIEMYKRDKTAPAVPSWMVMDSRYLSRYRLGGGAYKAGKPPEAWITSGYMKRGDTLETLARECGMAPQVLRRTVERFNGFARKGEDPDFGKGKSAYHRYWGDPTVKPSPNLGPLEKPPFYAIRIVPGDVGTAGGVMTDEHARVLRQDGSVIPGLYATGNATASVMGRSYPGAGASIAASMVFGSIAAAHATGSNR
jgi:3-oxosteroid 1-dehydrogenase